ncbi:MAG TPA: hypothetical protein PLI09_04500 [Candidatus Hydrogenedentes bacterium]|nr:hypothetical protein [Candidatus Hydrogenedentota bacterium]
MKKTAFVKVCAAFAVAIALGLLEASWTTPTAPGATRPMLGSFGIMVVLAVVCWPRLWWVPALGMIEELVQIFVGQLPPVRPSVYDALFHHWSAGFTPINLYPYISFPILGSIGEIWYRYFGQPTPVSENFT